MFVKKIQGVREVLDEEEAETPEDLAEDDPYSDTSPALLLGMGRSMTKQELLVDIPPRSVTDRLVSRFLKTSEPSLSEYQPTYFPIYTFILIKK